MTSIRLSLATSIRRWWGELLVVAAWLALLLVADYTSRVPQLLGGTLAVTCVLGAIRYLDRVRQAAREAERDLAAEIVLAVRIPRELSPAEQLRLEAFRARVARAIRGQGAHLREDRHAAA